MVIKCEQCGATIQNEAKFCQYCGAKLPVEEKPDVKERKISIESINHTRIRLAEIKKEREKQQLQAEAEKAEKERIAKQKANEYADRQSKRWLIIGAVAFIIWYLIIKFH